MRRLLYLALAALYLLHNDFWFWTERREIFGLPAGFAYHVAYCLAASALMAALVNVALPADSEPESPGPGSPAPESPGPENRGPERRGPS